MVEVHGYVGFFVVALFAVGWIWGLFAWITKRDPGERFWVWVTVAQIVSGVQALIGIVVFVSGYRAETMLHYAYGIFPIVALAVAHVFARRPGLPRTAMDPVRVGRVHLLRADRSAP